MPPAAVSNNRPATAARQRRSIRALLLGIALTVGCQLPTSALAATPAPEAPAVGAIVPEAPLILPAPATDEFQFVVLGDSQFHDPPLFNRMIDDIRHLNPAFVVQVGDMIEGYADPDVVAAEWIRFRQQIVPLGAIPFMPVPGNHDLYNAERLADPLLEQLYRQQWGATYYAFDYRNVRFIVINSDAPGEERSIGAAQWRWLEAQLAEAAGRQIILFMHRPPASLDNAEALHALLRQHPVRYLFYGHHHHYHFQERDGIRYVMTNAAATGALPIAEVGGFNHLLLVSVRDAEIRYAVIPADSIRAADTVAPADNYDLFDLYRQLAPDTLALTVAGENRWTASMPLYNPTTRALMLYVQCRSADHRWVFTPVAIAPVPLAAGARVELPMALHFDATRVPESTPVCELQVPYQTSRGEWVNYRREIGLSGF